MSGASFGRQKARPLAVRGDVRGAREGNPNFLIAQDSKPGISSNTLSNQMFPESGAEDVSSSLEAEFAV